jgi:hypothetical protein
MSISGTAPKKESVSVDTVLWFAANVILSIHEKLQVKHYSSPHDKTYTKFRQTQLTGTNIRMESHTINTVTLYIIFACLKKSN